MRYFNVWQISFRSRTNNSTPKPPSLKRGESRSPPEAATVATTATPKSPLVTNNQQSGPYLALPTNPIIIVPYSFIRNASVIPGPL